MRGFGTGTPGCRSWPCLLPLAWVWTSNLNFWASVPPSLEWGKWDLHPRDLVRLKGSEKCHVPGGHCARILNAISTFGRRGVWGLGGVLAWHGELFLKTASSMSTHEHPASSPLPTRAAWSPHGHVCHQTPFYEPKDGSGQTTNHFEISEINFWLLHLKVFKCTLWEEDEMLFSPLLPFSFFILLLWLFSASLSPGSRHPTRT